MSAQQKRQRKRRRGAATVEFAFVGSALFVILFAGIEFARANMVRNTIENAAYEGARVGIISGATSGECSAAADSYLQITGIHDATVNVTPSVIDHTTTQVSVSITVPMNLQNGYVFPRFFLGKSLASSITLSREG